MLAHPPFLLTFIFPPSPSLCLAQWPTLPSLPRADKLLAHTTTTPATYRLLYFLFRRTLPSLLQHIQVLSILLPMDAVGRHAVFNLACWGG